MLRKKNPPKTPINSPAWDLSRGPIESIGARGWDGRPERLFFSAVADILASAERHVPTRDLRLGPACVQPHHDSSAPGRCGLCSRSTHPDRASSSNGSGRPAKRSGDETIFRSWRSRAETTISSDRPDQTTGFDHVEHRQRPDLLFHNRAALEVNFQRCGLDPGRGPPSVRLSRKRSHPVG
jgi:hypothetical protein